MTGIYIERPPLERDDSASGAALNRFHIPPLVVLPAIVALVFIVFGRSLAGDYVYDGKMLTDAMARWTWENVPALVTPGDYGQATVMLSWRPLTAFTHFFADHLLFGGRPGLSHALNLVLHALNGWLLFLLLRRIPEHREGAAEWAALCGTLLFLLHPLVTEVVYCVGFRGDISALNFALLALLCVVKWAETRKDQWLAPAMILYGIGLLHKEIAYVALPMAPLLVLLTCWDRRWFRAQLACFLFFIVTICFFLAWRLFRHEILVGERLGGGGRMLAICNFLVASSEIYLNNLVLPADLRTDHHFVPVTSLVDARVTVAFAKFAAWLVILWPLCRRRPLASAGLAWIVFGFLPVSQIVRVPDPVAERFAYVPMVGAAFVVAALCEYLLSAVQVRLKPLLAVVGTLAFVLGIVSNARGIAWQDDYTLNLSSWEDLRPRGSFEDHQRLSQEASIARGALYLSRAIDARRRAHWPPAWEDLESGLRELERAVFCEPGNAEPWRLLALVRHARDQRPEALAAITRAEQLAPEHPGIAAAKRFIEGQ